MLPLIILGMIAGDPAGAASSQTALRHRYTIEADRANPRFIAPVALFFDSKKQELHVADAGTGVVTTFAGNQGAVGRFHHRQKGSDQKSEPAGLAVDLKGNIAVSDALVDRVFVYDYRGEPSGQMKMPHASSDRLMPGKMAVDRSGRIYVAVRNAATVCVFGPDGALERQVEGAAFGANECSDVAVDDAGNIWMLSPKGTAVHMFDKQSRHVRQFGSHGVGKASFARPAAIDVDGRGRVWVSDMVTHTLKVFDANGAFLAEFGGLGGGKGEFFSPTDLCIDRATETLFVLEKSGLRVQAFAIEDGGKTP